MAMSFKEAFAKARKEKGAGKTFKWEGKTYTTNYAEEAGKKDSAPKSSARPKARSKKKYNTDGGQDHKAATTNRSVSKMKDKKYNTDGGQDYKAATTNRSVGKMSGKTLDGVSLEEFKNMTGPERIKAGLPLTLMGFKKDMERGENTTPKSQSKRGDRARRREYNKGGMVGTPGRFSKSGSPTGCK